MATTEFFSHDSRSQDRDINLAPLEKKAGLLIATFSIDMLGDRSPNDGGFKPQIIVNECICVKAEPNLLQFVATNTYSLIYKNYNKL
jgi:hypothetical protein